MGALKWIVGGGILTITCPIWGAFYIAGLGSVVNRYCWNESGCVFRKNNLGRFERINCETNFEDTLSSAPSLPWALLAGGVPALPYPFLATGQFITHIYQKGFDNPKSTTSR
jgi:hypothetical protein